MIDLINAITSPLNNALSQVNIFVFVNGHTHNMNFYQFSYSSLVKV